jgi:5-methyltetrahydrofolate corrinoid/iron sulfur protein methyltransferase
MGQEMQLIADNIHIINPVVRKAIERMDPDPIQKIAAKCVAAGADAIDINPGPLTREPETRMAFLVEAVQSAARVPLLIDTTNPSAMEAGLRTSRNTTIINGFSLEPHKLETILPLAKKYNSDIIGYLLYPDSRVPGDAPERFEIAIQIHRALQENGIDEHHLIIDPIVVPLAWQDGNRQAMEVMGCIRALPDLLGFPVRTIAGVSNLTSGFGNTKKKIQMEQAYLPMLAAAGLDMALLNILHEETTDVARACRLLIRPGIFSWEEL